MIGLYIGREVITVIRRTPGPPDVLGVPTWIETTFDVPGCSVQPASTDEQLSNVDIVISRWRLFAPADLDLIVTDGVRLGDLLFQVDGDPQVWPDFVGRPHHTEAFLRRATG